MATLTQYPNVGTSFDGYAQQSYGTTAWGTIRAAGGDGSGFGTATLLQTMNSSTTTNGWQFFRRIIIGFDTSSLGAGATVTGAVLSVVLISVGLNDFDDDVSIVRPQPASDSSGATGDYDSFDGLNSAMTKQAADKAVSGLTADSSTYTDFTLNSTGEGNVDVSGTTFFGIVAGHDADNDEPTWGSDESTSLTWAAAEETVSGDKRPKLVVTYTPAPITLAAVEVLDESPQAVPIGVVAY